jgi:LemA protein
METRRSAAMSLAFMIFLAVVAAMVIFVIVSYNRLVSLTQRTQSAWSDVDVQLKRRTDLVPNLVESVKGYAAHERATLDAVIRARGAAVAAQTPESRAQAEGQLTQALRGLFALAESYPDLKASVNFQSLQASLGEIEDAVQSARRYFNAVVRDLNTTIEIFPSNLVAGLFQFREHAYFELDRPEERQVPKVSFGA